MVFLLFQTVEGARLDQQQAPLSPLFAERQERRPPCHPGLLKCLRHERLHCQRPPMEVSSFLDFEYSLFRTNSYSLDKSLQALASPVGDTDQEMLRFMHPLLESLFQLWEEWEQQELPVFNVIIAFLRLLGELFPSTRLNFFRRAPKCRECRLLQPLHREVPPRQSCLVRLFISHHQSLCSRKMMKCLHHYIESASKSNNDLARNSLKMVGGIFQIIVAAKIAMDK